MKRKALSFAIAAILTMSCAPAIGYAEGENDLHEATRAEALVNILKSIGKDAEVQAETSVNPFNDVPDWADRYVAYAYKNGITYGVSDTEFDSDRIITAEEYAAMLQRTANWVDSTPAESAALELADQGFFAAGGTVLETEGTFDPIDGQYDPTGSTLHADHTSIFYQIPAKANGHSMVFLHGYGQSRLGWMGTPDGRDGWSDMFLKKGYSVYLADQPRHGESGTTSVPAEITATTDELGWFTQFRLGRWPSFNEGSQFPQDEESLNQFFRQGTPDTGEFNVPVVADALIKAFDKAGDGILVTHSRGGIPGWNIAAGSDKVEAVVAIEPGTFPFPESEMPDPIPSKYYTASGYPVSDEDFEKIISKPIVAYFGDYIPDEESDLPAENFWRGVREIGYQFAELANSRGGDVTIVYLPDEGITGNSHFMFQEKNNQEIADHVYAWLAEKGLN